MKELNCTAVKDIRNLFQKKKPKLRDIKNLSEHEGEKNYYEPVRVSNFWSNNCIEYKSNSDRNVGLPFEKCLNRNRPYLTDIINNFKNSDTWKIQLTIENNYISSIVPQTMMKSVQCIKKVIKQKL